MQNLTNERDTSEPRIATELVGTEELVAHLGAAYNLARWLTSNPDDAEDMVQEAYLKAFKYRSSFRGGQVRPWLLAIVRNSCYDFLRQRQLLEKNSTFEEELHSVTQEGPSPETALLQRARSELVRNAVAQLPAEFREVLVLRDLEGLSYLEIATIVGIPLGTVMSRLNRARKQIQYCVLLQQEVAPHQLRADLR